MTATIIKHQSSANSKGNKMMGCAVFKVKLPFPATVFLGKEIKIRRTDHGFVLSPFGTISEGYPSIIANAGWLTLSQSLIEEFEDLGEYNLDFDYENEEINLIKK